MPVSTEDCQYPSYGHINQDGYVRVLDRPRAEGGKLIMHHRKVWEEKFGKIPIGYEINHICKDRRCSNINHLECLPIAEHRAKDNALRYRDREDAIVEYIKQNPGLTQKQIAKVFGVSQSGVSLVTIRNRKRYENNSE